MTSYGSITSLTVSSLHFTIPRGIGAAARFLYGPFDLINVYRHDSPYRIRAYEKHLSSGSTCVSNELGAGNPYRARVAVCTTMFLATMEACLIGTTLFCC